MIGFNSRCIDNKPPANPDARRLWDRTEVWLAQTAPERKERLKAVMTAMPCGSLAPTEGRKDDADKARIDLIAPELLTGTAEILAFGAAKYGERNWEKGMAWSRAFGALMRHMWAWWAGEKADEETGKSHLWHAAASLMFLIAYEERKTGTDDRPTKTP